MSFFVIGISPSPHFRCYNSSHGGAVMSIKLAIIALLFALVACSCAEEVSAPTVSPVVQAECPEPTPCPGATVCPPEPTCPEPIMCPTCRTCPQPVVCPTCPTCPDCSCPTCPRAQESMPRIEPPTYPERETIPDCAYGEKYDDELERCVQTWMSCTSSEEWDYFRDRCVPKGD
jgi:hypothetical protein